MYGRAIDYKPSMTQSQHDDAGRMSFGDHLEELRRRVLWSVLGVIVLFLGALFFQDTLLDVIKRPHRVAMRELASQDDDRAPYSGPYGWIAFAVDEHELDRSSAPREPRPDLTPEERARFDRIVEKRKRFFADPRASADELVVTSYPEGFVTGLKAAFIFALIAGTPWTLFQLWLFVSAGLYPHERRWVLLFLPSSLALFLGGATFGYFVLIPYGLFFLAGMTDAPAMITLGTYFSLFATLTFALGVIFQLPLAMVACTMIGVVRARVYSEKRRYFILAAFVVGAMLTPPDPVTQLLMAIPILLLYELGIHLARAMERRGVDAPEADDGGSAG